MAGPIYQPLTSSLLSGYHYDPATGRLRLSLKAGGEYDFHDVPKGVVDQLAQAKSAGAFFGSTIRGQFKTSKVEKAK